MIVYIIFQKLKYFVFWGFNLGHSQIDTHEVPGGCDCDFQKIADIIKLIWNSDAWVLANNVPVVDVFVPLQHMESE